MSNRRPFGHTLAELAITVVIVAIFAAAGYYVARGSDIVLDWVAEEVARGQKEWDVLFPKELSAEDEKFLKAFDARVQKETDAANAKFLADIGAKNDRLLEEKYSKAWERLEAEKRIQTNTQCLEYSWAFRDARREEVETARATSAAARAAAMAVAQAAEWEEERALRKRAALGLMVAGQLSEAMGKAQTAGFKASFLRQAGVQLQVVAMELTGATYANPMMATAQGFLIGL